MIIKIKFVLILTIFTLFSSVYGQKGMFRQGKVLQKKYTDTLNFKMVNGAILVDVVIEKKKYKLFLDTGAPTLFSNKITGNFKVMAEDEITDGANKTEVVKYIEIPKINIGNISYQDIMAAQHNIKLLGKFEIDGILGANIMAKSVWDFNLKTHQIIISNKINKNVVDGVKPAKLKIIQTGSPLLTIDYFDIVEEEIFVDFGFNGLYSLANKVYTILEKNNKIKKSISGSGKYLQTAFDYTDSIYRQVILTSSKIDHIQLPDFIADVDYDEQSSIGSKWLEYYRIIIDFPKHKIYFLPNGKKMKKKFESYGIKSDVQDDKLLISFVWHSSKAFKKGIRFSDQILSINGMNTQYISLLTDEQKAKIKKTFERNGEITLEINTKGNFIKLNKEVLLN